MIYKLIVFVSSTADLKAHRDAIESTLEELDINGSRFEAWPPVPDLDGGMAECLRRVDEADAVILLIEACLQVARGGQAVGGKMLDDGFQVICQGRRALREQRRLPQGRVQVVTNRKPCLFEVGDHSLDVLDDRHWLRGEQRWLIQCGTSVGLGVEAMLH